MQGNGRHSGFSLIEVLVVMVIFSIIIVAASQTFISLLSDFKRQSKIAATNIEGMLGLEVMRRDIASAGYGLYWSFDPKTAPSSTPFGEPEISASVDANGAALNDDLVDDACYAPRALVFGSGYGLNQSDRIAVKSMNVAASLSSENFNYLYTYPTESVNSWIPASYNIPPTDYVVVIKPDDSHRWLVFPTSGSAFSAQFSNVMTSYPSTTSASAGLTTSLIFSLGTNSAPRLPFNRADYYIAATNVPSRCASGTGVLYKQVMDNRPGSSGFLSPIPLLDCVADMQVVYRYNTSGTKYADLVTDVSESNGVRVYPADDPTNPGDVLSQDARNIREVRVYILAQEGQRDNLYTFPTSSLWVGEQNFQLGLTSSISVGREFDLTTISNYQNYRWKLYTLIVEPLCQVKWGEANP